MQNSVLRRDILTPRFGGENSPLRCGLWRKVMAETRKLAAILAADVVGYSPAVEASAAFDLSYAVLSW